MENSQNYSDMKLSDIKFDCRHFRGDIPCIPNKRRDKSCVSCDEYDAIRTRILIIKLGAIGDVIRTTPLLHRFREEFPGAHISWVTLTPKVIPTSIVDKVYKFNFRSVYALTHIKLDIVVNLDKDIETCALLNNVSATQKFGFGLHDGHIIPVNHLATHKFMTGCFDEVSKQNTKSYLEEIFEICGFDFRQERYILDVNTEYDKLWEHLHKMAGGRKIIGLNTGAGKRWLTRLWPDAYWLELIEKLQSQGYFPLLLGGPEEEGRNRNLTEKTNAYYPGIFPLEKFISLCSQCDAIVTAVTMTMHVAIALRVPLILFIYIFNPHEFELYDNGVMIQPETGCDCYYAETCHRERHCMEDISVLTVFEAIEKMVSKNREIR